MRMMAVYALCQFVCFNYNVLNAVSEVVTIKMFQLLPGVILILKHLPFQTLGTVTVLSRHIKRWQEDLNESRDSEGL
jgi:hypothetical protein